MASLISAITGTGDITIELAHVNDIRELLNGTTAYRLRLIANDNGAWDWVPATSGFTATNYAFRLYHTDGTTLRLGIRYNGVLDSDVATGTAPLEIASTTVVTNLNADLLDGLNTSATAGGTIVSTTGTETLTNKTLTAPTIADFTNAAHDHGDADDGGTVVAGAVGLTTTGDMLYRDASALARLGIGTANYLLRVNAGATAPEWASQAAALALTTAGDLVYATSSTAIARLAIGSAGQVLRVNSGATAPEWGQVARIIRKTADETVTNDTYQNDDVLTFTGAASTAYAVFVHLFYDSGTTPDIKVRWSVPGTSTARWSAQFYNTTLTWTQSGAQWTEANAMAAGGQGAGTPTEAYIWAMIAMDATGGTVALQWAQNTNDGTNTKVLAGSWMSISQV